MKPTNVPSWVIGLGSLLAIIAASGDKTLAVLAGVPNLIRAFADGLPGGLWSFLLAAAVAGLLHHWGRSWFGKSLGLELATILSGIAVCNALAWRSDAAQHVSAALVGLLGGLVGLYASKAAYGWRMRRRARRADAAGCPPEQEA